MFLPALIGVLAIAGFAVFFWKSIGPGSGRSLGRKIAAHNGIQKNVFFQLMAHGVNSPNRNILATMKRSQITVEAASIELGPILLRGVERLEARFGEQDAVNLAKPRIKQLAALAQAGQNQSKTSGNAA